MIKRIRKSEKIPDCFKGYDPAHWFFELFDKDGVYGYAALYFDHLPNCEFHMEVTRFSPRILTMLKEVDWPLGLEIMRFMGATHVLVSRPGTKDRQAKFYKFIQQFGFTEPVNFTVAYCKIEGVNDGKCSEGHLEYVQSSGGAEASEAA